MIDTNAHISPKYVGKSLSSVSSILKMALAYRGANRFEHLGCITGYSFGKIFPLDDFSKCFSSFVGPWQGLLMALDTLGLQENYRVETKAVGEGCLEDKVNIINKWLCDGPVIFGPLDRGVLWNRIDTAYFRGGPYFLFLLESLREDVFIAHDPDGCPFRQISLSKILNNEYKDDKQGILQICSIDGLQKRKEVYLETITKGYEIRIGAAKRKIAGNSGLKALAKNLLSNKLKSSDEGALSFGISEFGLSVRQIFVFVNDLPQVIPSMPLSRSTFLEKYLKILNEYYFNCAEALDYLRERDQTLLAEKIIQFADKENLIDDLFHKLVRCI